MKIIRELRPDAIISPDPLAVFFGEHHYNHRDHRVVGWAALDAAAPAAALPLYFRGTGAAHQVTTAYLSGSLQPSVWVDVSSTIDRKIEAVACHRSQLTDAGDWIASALRDGAADAGRDAGVGYAEPFRRVSLGDVTTPLDVLHVDMDAFFAAVEVLDDPSLARPTGDRGRDRSPWRGGIVLVRGEGHGRPVRHVDGRGATPVPASGGAAGQARTLRRGQP